MLNFRRKQIVAQNQIEKLVKAKAELECNVTEKDQQLKVIRKKLHMKKIHNEDQSNYLEHDGENGDPRDRASSDSSRISGQFNENESLKNEVSEMIMINTKDPDRPRFTLKELQKVLMEKNQLTIKLDQTNDELEHLRRGYIILVDLFKFFGDLTLSFGQYIVRKNWLGYDIIILIYFAQKIF